MKKQTKLKLSEVAKNQANIGPLGLAQSKDAQLFARAQFTPDEVKNLKTQFEQLDFDNDQRITRVDVVRAMAEMGYDASVEKADSILREVDFGRKGAIEFPDYLDIAAGLKELQLDSAFTHLAQLDSSRKIAERGEGQIGQHADDSGRQRGERRKIPVERSGGGT